MIQPVTYINELDLIPQAIFLRSLRYFSTVIVKGEDELDLFEAAPFIIGNWLSFDIRTYRGDPPHVTTLYTADALDGFDITEIIQKIIRLICLPQTAVAWQRGQPYEFGKIERPPNDRLTEIEARILCLKIASQCSNHEASTNYIKKQIPLYTNLSQRDLLPSTTRKRERRWQQIVGNVISHQVTKRGIFQQGLAVRTKTGLRVTQRGLDYLNNIGFSV